jgi:hypothetical protein
VAGAARENLKSRREWSLGAYSMPSSQTHITPNQSRSKNGERRRSTTTSSRRLQAYYAIQLDNVVCVDALMSEFTG